MRRDPGPLEPAPPPGPQGRYMPCPVCRQPLDTLDVTSVLRHVELGHRPEPARQD